MSGPRGGLAASATAQAPGPASASPPDALAFVELDAARSSPWLQEPVEVALRFGVAADLERDGLLQLFQARLDVPVHVSIGDLLERGGAELEVLPSTDALDASFALDDAIARARRVDDRTRDGTRFSTWQIALRVLPTAPGRLVLAAPTLRFASATRFEERFVDGRVALDRREGLVTGEPLVLDVRPLPEADRPPGFGGAVGHFTLEASVRPREVRVGESVKLELVIGGEGNHGHFDAPELTRMEGFHVLGRLVEREPRRLVAIYDLAPRDERVESVPPVTFACFVPGPEPGYALLTTPAFPVRVLPREHGTASDPHTDQAPRADDTPPRSAGARRGALLAFLASALAAVVLAALALVARARRRA